MSTNKWNRILYDAYSLDTEEEINRFLNIYEIILAGNTVKIHQSKPKTNNSVGLIVWDGSLVLAKYLEKLVLEKSFDILGKSVIELGAGCGIPGIAASLLGGKVTLTDLPRILDQLQLNADVNLKGKSQFEYKIKELIWGKTPLSSFDAKYDVILGADVIYYDKAIKALLKTCWDLSHQNSLILLAFEMHVEEAADTFWEFVTNYFTVTKIPYSQLDSFYKDKDIQVVKLTRLESIVQSEKSDEDVRLHDSESDYSDDWGSDDDSNSE